MTQEDKELLLQDLCARLPYRVKVQYEGNVKEIQYIEPEFEEICFVYPDNSFTIEVADCKPYLRPMSSMTEEERNEIRDYVIIDEYNRVISDNEGIIKYINWLNRKMFDYRGLIPMGLALEAPEDMYK